VKVVFLCGGVGKRMFPLTEDKLLLKFLGKPFIQYQIERAKEAGLNRFVVVGNPQNLERIERIAGNLPGVEVEFAVQEHPLGIADALQKAERLLDEEVMVLNPNDVFEGVAYTSLIKQRKKGTAMSYILGYQVKEHFPGGYLVVDEANRLKQIVEKPRNGEEPSNLVNIMIHLHTNVSRCLEYVKNVQTDRDDVYECALDKMAKEGYTIEVLPYRNFWAAIKYPWHIFAIVRHFLDGTQPRISPSAQVSSRATIEGKVIIEDNVRVLENAVIRGPAYIGANSIIGNNVLVRQYSHIGADCVVGYCTEVKGSYIGDKCWFHSSYVGDSIIAEGCSFGAGTVLANFRFDEGNISVRVGDEMVDTGLDKLGAMMGENCKTGINASILPGVRVGANTFVGPHVCLTADVEPNKMVLPEPRYRVMQKEIELDDKKKEELMRKLGKLECAE
jgi:bifunctional UDP-N-acetylglucosamine pyrophosphorylase/glucosamine-1-phosphate N-acetyltransferase